MQEIINGKPVNKTFHILPRWKGEPIQDTYGNKSVLDKNGKPVFAEIFALEEFKEQGYEGGKRIRGTLAVRLQAHS